MKKFKLFTTLLALYFAVLLNAQAPIQFKYQAVLHDTEGNVVANEQAVLLVEILQSGTNGNEVFSETHNVSTSMQGNINLDIGSVNTAEFSLINWANGPYFIRISVNGVIMGTSQLLSVPYALYAAKAGNSFSGSYTDLTNRPDMFNGDYNTLDNKPIIKDTITKYGFNGDYNNLSNKPKGNKPGEILYWDGSTWVAIKPGKSGQTLTICNGMPRWGICPVLPSLSNFELTNITGTSVTCSVIIDHDGNDDIEQSGICWSSTPNPTINDNVAQASLTDTAYSLTLTGLTSNTTYFVRAFATNMMGTAYTNEIPFGTLLEVGSIHQGGIVAYILQSGDPGYDPANVHGIIAAPTDQSAGIAWGKANIIGQPYNFHLLPLSDSLGAGKRNAELIDSLYGEGNYAAKMCINLVIDGYSDWYLPSKDELNKIYLNKSYLGHFEDNYYHTSSRNGISIWTQHFGNGSFYSTYVTQLYCLRAIRYF